MKLLERTRRFFHDDETHFVELARHFFHRFFDNELVSPGGEAHLTLVHALALLAVPAVLYTFYLFSVYDDIGQFFQWLYPVVSLIDRCRYVFFSMVTIGFIAVLEWDALFPDYRDYVVLTVLPLKSATVFTAKVAALGIFVALFTVDVGGLPALLYPFVEAQGLADPRVPFLHLARMILAHGLAVGAGSAFMFLFFVALEGLLINLLSYRRFRQVSLYVQLASMIALLSIFFLLPTISSRVPIWRRNNSLGLYLLPPAWFLGLYQRLLGIHDAVDAALARLAVGALVLAAVVSAAAYLGSYRKYVRRSFEQSESVSAGPGWVARLLTRLADALVVRKPLERASFYFVGKTLARSSKHRLYFAAYVGVGCAFVVEGLVGLFAGRRTAGITRADATLLSVPLVLSFFALSGMRVVFPIPAELRANWIFQLTEDERRRECLAGVRKAMLVFVIVPLFLVLFPVDAALSGWKVALVESLFGVTLSLALAELLLLRFFKIPFTCSFLPGKANITVLGVFYWFAFSIYAYSMASLEAWMIKHPLSLLPFFALAISGLAALIRYRNRVLDEGFQFVYEDEPEPAVRRLKLSD
ncbi:MAG TPA: hypothetical protein VG204_11840 [Terriglobia bacterium]|nr:hypothetical protein [Terriglobia bacterium]